MNIKTTWIKSLAAFLLFLCPLSAQASDYRLYRVTMHGQNVDVKRLEKSIPGSTVLAFNKSGGIYHSTQDGRAYVPVPKNQVHKVKTAYAGMKPEAMKGINVNVFIKANEKMHLEAMTIPLADIKMPKASMLQRLAAKKIFGLRFKTLSQKDAITLVQQVGSKEASQLTKSAALERILLNEGIYDYDVGQYNVSPQLNVRVMP